jgi:Na+/H+-dicarboxylate symporter
MSFNSVKETSVENVGYVKYLIDIFPDSIFSAFSENKVLRVLLISIVLGISTRFIKNLDSKNIMISFFKGLHSIFFIIIGYIIKLLPIGLFGFVTESVCELKNDMSLKGMGGYFLVIILANIVHGIVVLPAWLIIKKVDPIRIFKVMFPALSVSFFSKSSSAAIPISMELAETKLGIDKKTSRFVMPLASTINMNGCAIFIFTTVVYIMQNYGVEITWMTILTWIIIGSIAAIGNAGVPMGCFLLSSSLLSSMNIPMPLLGVILPFYSVIDMLESSLNVWSNTCLLPVIGSKNTANFGLKNTNTFV